MIPLKENVAGQQTEDIHLSDRGALPDEPCLFCHRTGGVYFVIDDSPFGKTTAQVISCSNCNNSWTTHTGKVPALR